MKVIFFDIDTINDFMNKDGALYVPFAETIKPVLAEITSFSVKKNIVVVDICDCHREDDLEISNTPDFKTTFPPHAMDGTSGCFMIDETYRPIANSRNDLNFYLPKNQVNVFDGKSGKQIEIILDAYKPDFVVVYGVAADFCVDRAVEGLLTRGIKVFVVNDATVPINTDDFPRLLFRWIDDGAIIAKWSSIRNLLLLRQDDNKL